MGVGIYTSMTVTRKQQTFIRPLLHSAQIMTFHKFKSLQKQTFPKVLKYAVEMMNLNTK